MRNAYLSIVALLLAAMAHGQVLISNVNHAVHASNVLRYNVTFSTDVPAKSWVDYYFIDGVDTVWNSTGVTEMMTTSHSVPVIGLVPQTTYTYEVNAFDPEGCVNVAGGTFLTDTLPANLPWMDSLWVGNDVNLPGYIMTNGHSNPDKPVQIYDRKGRLIWYDLGVNSTAGASNARCKFFTWDEDRRVFTYTDCHRVAVMKLDGTVIRDVDLSARQDLYLHHDVAFADNDDLVAVISQPRNIDQSSVGGLDTALVMGQGFIRIDDNDQIVEEWHNFEHYDTLFTIAPGGYWLPILGPTAYNWQHMNAIMVDDDGDYIVSFKNEHQLAKVDAGTGQILWKMGGQGASIDVDAQDVYMDQHCINKTPGDEYLIFDNTGLDSITRVMQWDIDFGYSTPMLFRTWDYTLPQQFFTDILGSVYKLYYDNYLIGTGRSRGVFEVSETGTQEWMARQSDWVYRAYLIDGLYDDPEELTPAFSSIICADDTAFALSATPDGGQWSGPGVTSGIFDPATAGVGFHDLVYKYGPYEDTVTVDVQDPQTCTASMPELAFGENLRVFPNPFENGFSICFELPNASSVRAELLDMNGKLIGTIFDTELPAGQNQFNSGDLNISEGVYLIRFTADGEQFYRRVVKR